MSNVKIFFRNLFWLHPWLSFLLYAGGIKTDLRGRGFFLLLGLATIVFAIVQQAINPSIKCFLNYVSLAMVTIFLPTQPLSRDQSTFARYFVYTGIIVGILLVSDGDRRNGLYGWEPNFSALWVWILSLLLLIEKRYKEWLLVFAIYLSLSLSKVFMIASLLSLVFFTVRHHRFICILIAAKIILALFMLQVYNVGQHEILAFLRHGYIDSPLRLLKIIDSSLFERLTLNIFWWDFYMHRPTSSIVFGEEVDYFLYASNIPHNSFIQKSIELGIFFAPVITIVVLAKLRIWISLPFMFFAYHLHGVLTAPVLMILIYLNHRRGNAEKGLPGVN
jgi:hypothetical protein